MPTKSKRRGAGEGTIVQRSDGRWSAAVSVGNGRRKWFYGSTRREVANKLTVALKSVQDGVALPPERQTLATFADQWLESVRSKLKSSTHQRYAHDLRRHLLPTLGRLTLVKISPQDIQRLYATKDSEGLSPTSVHHMHVVLQRVLGQALKWGLVSRNAASLTDPPRPVRHEMQVLDAKQVRTLLSETADDRLGALYLLASFTGIRQGELFALKWTDIDLDTGVIHIRRTLRWGNRDFEFDSPKTAKSERPVAISAKAITALRKHRSMQSTEAVRLGPSWNDTELVFTDRAGGPLRPQNFLRRDFRPALERAGLPSITFHQLRHTAASLALANGVPVPDVSAMLGHAGPHITLKTYAHIMPGSERQTAEAMEAAIYG
jgi:integrase